MVAVPQTWHAGEVAEVAIPARPRFARWVHISV